MSDKTASFVIGKPEYVLELLRWKEDDRVINAFGEDVFLKPCIDPATGKRIGLTDCCLAEAPCERHQRLIVND